MAVYDEEVIESICSRLRDLIQDAFQSHLYQTAIFYADKLVSLRQGSTDRQAINDVYTLTECYFKNGEYRRVLKLLKKYEGLGMKDPRLTLLAAQSLIECKEYEECLNFLDEKDSCDENFDNKSKAVFALLRGKVYEVMENQENALLWYEKAIDNNPYCHEALDRLIGNHLLSHEKEVQLLSRLQFHKEDEWLRHMYAARLQGAKNPFDPTPVADRHPQAPLRNVTNILLANQVLANLDEYPAPQLPVQLTRNGHTLAAQATKYYYTGDYEACYVISKSVLEDDPYMLSILPVHIAALVQLDMKNLVFYITHQLVNAYPTSAVSWFCAGCYYFMIKKYEHSRRFFAKATALDHHFAPAWIAYGHAFAQHDESDQALAAYRTASRLFPGSHLPWLFIGMEYVRTNSFPLAQQCLDTALSLMPQDPAILNELGVVAFLKKDYSTAAAILEKTATGPKANEVYCNNFAHALIKCKRLEDALEAFTQALRLSQGTPNSGTLVGLGYVHHLLGRISQAIELYHRALSMNREDSFATEMLNYAVQDYTEFI